MNLHKAYCLNVVELVLKLRSLILKHVLFLLPLLEDIVYYQDPHLLFIQFSS